ncbi:MAG: hypothetical protein SWE60_13375 [Thermodesulfobacteriota bacterium]|nr:hypothetical protein [Thermodesulfobacteriota bacterium]
MRRLSKVGAICLVLALLISTKAFGADVDVYAEGAYTESNLVVYLYGDISTTPILSCGVKLTYDDSELEVVSATKNEETWYMGTPDEKEPYMDPDTGTSGEVLIVNGKLDTGDPLAGVTGERVLLGSVRFNRLETSMPFTPSLSIDYGRAAPYDNFVATDGTVLDSSGVVFGLITIEQRADANADGTIDSRDIRALRKTIGSEDAPCWCDCNDDTVVDSRDIRCLRQKI